MQEIIVKNIFKKQIQNTKILFNYYPKKTKIKIGDKNYLFNFSAPKKIRLYKKIKKPFLLCRKTSHPQFSKKSEKTQKSTPRK